MPEGKENESFHYVYFHTLLYMNMYKKINKYPKENMKKKTVRNNKLSKFARFKINTQKSVAFLYSNNK